MNIKISRSNHYKINFKVANIKGKPVKRLINTFIVESQSGVRDLEEMYLQYVMFLMF